MGYLLLLGAQLCGAAKGYCGKKMGNYATNLQSAVLLNLIRTILCVAISFLLLLVTGQIGFLIPNFEVLLLSALSGMATAFFLVGWLLSVRKSAYMMLDVFLMSGTLVPILLGYYLFSEPISLRQWIGFGVLMVAVFIMCGYNNSIKAKLTPSAVILLIFVGVANGATSACQKVFVKTAPEVPVAVFNLYTYVFAAITLAICLLIFSRKEKAKFEKSASRITFVYILIMAVTLAANSYLLTMAASYLDSAQLYPMSQGLGLVLATFMATVFFKEKLRVNAVIGIGLSFAALMMINL